MRCDVFVKLKPGSQVLRAFLRENKFTVYRINLTGISADDGTDDPDNAPHYYEGYYNGNKPLPEAVQERLNEEFDKGLVLKYRTTRSQ